MKQKNNGYLQIRDAWVKRSINFGDEKRSVMDQSFPYSINEVIHRIHQNEILSVIPSGKIHCLDVGCGYGRLAIAVAQSRSTVCIDGIDIAPTFVKLFNTKMRGRGKATIGDARKLPYKSQTFDMVWMVVSLMYFPKKKDQQKVIKEIYRVLKPGGTFVLIEPNMLGEHIVRWGGLLPKLHGFIMQHRKQHTGGIAFTPHTLSALLEDSGFSLVSRRGYPCVTLLLTPLVIIGKILPGIAGWCLDCARWIDHFLPISSFSYIVTHVGKKYE